MVNDEVSHPKTLPRLAEEPGRANESDIPSSLVHRDALRVEEPILDPEVSSVDGAGSYL